ncbi:MAG: transposase [Verrucomicrobia bacterium]|nr:MAG: transposase [Verrucomicrobiota bacterium]
MQAKRRRHEPEFKARVALEALKGVKTIQQIAKDFDIHPDVSFRLEEDHDRGCLERLWSLDNVFIERLWRNVKYARIYLLEHATLTALRASLLAWFTRYNDWRPHETHGNATSSVIYQTRTANPPDDPEAATLEAA